MRVSPAAPVVSLDPLPGGSDPIDPAAAWLVDPGFAATHGLIPIASGGRRITVAVEDARDRAALAAVAAHTGLRPDAVVAPCEEIEAAQRRIYGRRAAGARRRRRRPDVPELPKPLIGQLLADRGAVTPEQVEQAVAQQARFGGRLGELLVATGMVRPDELSDALAQQLRMTAADLDRLEPDKRVVELIPEADAQRLRVVPLAEGDGTLYLAAADPSDPQLASWLERNVTMSVSLLVASAQSIDALLERAYAADNNRRAITTLLNDSPIDCANVVLYPAQRTVLAGFLLALVAGLVLMPLATLIALNVTLMSVYGVIAAYRFVLIYSALGHHYELDASEGELDQIDERELPLYTILVPLFREGEVVEKLSYSLGRLDYPPAKLEILLLLEEEDEETQRAVAELGLPAQFRPVIVPASRPQTKPKACNYGLTQARGEYVVIYDAEDIPEATQLKKVLIAFAKSDPSVVCVQSKLNYYNPDQNALTRWFTTEYSMWFDLLLPGLDATKAPIPLGGTSNHFETAKLIELGGWDPFNVTEDADLGLRLDRAGYRTAMVNSTTYEEANSNLRNWIRQRSRWVKGYVQTWLVQMRTPVKLLRQIGWRKWLSFQFVVGGTFLTFLLNPVYWALTTLWALTEADVIRSFFPGVVYYCAAFALFFGNFVFAYVSAAGASRRGYHGLVKWALLSPVYWALMSVGAWKGFIQLFHKPFFWEKTLHGLDAAR